MISSFMSLPRLRLGAAPIVLLALTSSVVAQTLPNIGDALRQLPAPTITPAPSLPLPAIGGQTLLEPALQTLPDDQPKIRIKSFTVLGNRFVSSSDLLALLANEVDKDHSLSDMQALASRLTRYYRNQGYFVARVYVPAQEIQEGVLTLRAVEGNYGEFHLINASRVRDSVVQAMLDDVKTANIVSLDTLERAMLLIDDTPGAQVLRADVLPGTQVGTSDFEVETVATDPYSGLVTLDNHGSRYTGQNRMSFQLNANSPTGSGDHLALSGLATGNGDLLNGRVAYALPLAPNGLRGEAAVSQTTYQLGDAYSTLDAKGTAKALDFSLSYPLRRTREQTVETSLGVSYKDLLDEILSTATRTPKSLASVTWGLSVRHESMVLGALGLTQGNLGLSLGSVNIRDASAAALDKSGANTQGQFTKISANLSRMSLLPDAYSLTVTLRYQQSLSGKNLDSSERMAVSGANGVMSYPSGELIGSNAIQARMELAHPLPVWNGLQSAWLVFTDWGQAKAAQVVSTSDQRRSIADVGLGWNGSYRNAIFKAYLAHRLDSTDPISEPAPRNKLLAQVSWIY